MSRRLLGIGLLTVAVVSLPLLPTTQARAQKNPNGDPIDAAKLPAGEFVGTLKTTPGSDKKFTVEVEQAQLVPTGAGSSSGTNPRIGKQPNLNRLNQAQQRIAQAQQRVVQAQQQVATAGNPGGRKNGQSALAKAQNAYNKAMGDLAKAQGNYQQALAQLLAQANAQTNILILAAVKANGTGIPKGYRIQKSKVVIEFQAAETVQVRTAVLPEEFDEKGNPKKYTKAELAELKGKDKTLPGYESSLEKLETGQVVRVLLATHKKPARKPAKKDADKEDDNEKDDETAKKRQARRIIILAEAKSSDTTPAKPKKK